MKLLILGDLHYGIKSNEYVVDKKLNCVLNEYVFPYMKKNSIRHIVHLGDVFENRKGVNSESGFNYVKYFLLPIIENDLILYQILGNHDIFYDKNNKINTLKMFFSLINNSNLKLIENYERIVLDKKKIYLVSYGSDIDISEIYGDILFGHFNIDGFEMQKGVSVYNGMKQSLFSNFKNVFSGHIHRRDKQKNITYVGSLVENNFGENDFIHGFYVFDLDKNEIEFIPIEEKIFIKIKQDEIDKYDNFNDKVVEIEFNEENSSIESENIIEKLQILNPTGIKIKYINKEIKNIEVENYDFMNVLKEYIENIEEKFNKEILFKIIMKFYGKV